jgi:hypothetical protein
MENSGLDEAGRAKQRTRRGTARESSASMDHGARIGGLGTGAPLMAAALTPARQ